MCFSAEADLIAGAVVGGAGIDALRHVRHRREWAVASLPLIFGAHQMIETLTWWGLDGHIPAGIGRAATWVYLVIAFLLPALIPIAILLIEPDGRRRRTVAPFVGLGAAVTAVLMFELFTGPVTAEVKGLYIAYDVSLDFGGQLTALYVAATCVPLLLSTSPRFVIFGILNLAAVAALAWLMATGVISLWCAWAAVTSIVIVIHLRAGEGSGRPALSAVAPT